MHDMPHTAAMPHAVRHRQSNFSLVCRRLLAFCDVRDVEHGKMLKASEECKNLGKDDSAPRGYRSLGLWFTRPTLYH